MEKEEAGKSDKASKIPDKAGDEEGDVHKTKETEKSKPEETDTVPEKGESKPKDKSKPKEEEPKKPAKSSGTDKKSDTQESQMAISQRVVFQPSQSGRRRPGWRHLRQHE